jgi:hypothetical protein
VAGVVTQANLESLVVGCDLEEAADAMAVLVDEIKDTGTVNVVVEDDIGTVAEVSVELEVIEVSESLDGAVVVE